MQIDKLSKSNPTNFNGHQNVKFVKDKLMRVKKQKSGSIKLFVAGGQQVDKKVALANKKLIQEYKPKVKENKPNSVLMFFAGVLSAFGLDKLSNK